MSIPTGHSVDVEVSYRVHLLPDDMRGLREYGPFTATVNPAKANSEDVLTSFWVKVAKQLDKAAEGKQPSLGGRYPGLLRGISPYYDLGEGLPQPGGAFFEGNSWGMSSSPRGCVLFDASVLKKLVTIAPARRTDSGEIVPTDAPCGINEPGISLCDAQGKVASLWVIYAAQFSQADDTTSRDHQAALLFNSRYQAAMKRIEAEAKKAEPSSA